MNLEQILLRLHRLEAETAVRNCINRYMQICDALGPDTDLDALMDLFDPACIWEGVGQKYSKIFGYYRSKTALYDMFKSYTQQQSHFSMNAHFVSSEQIYVEHQQAHATWLMLQTSEFRDGRCHLNAAKLNVKFQQQPDGVWKIKHFQTENIFSRPVAHWNSTAELPVPNQG